MEQDRERKDEVQQLTDVKDPGWRWPTHEKWWSDLEGTWKTRETTGSNNSDNLRDGVVCPFEVTTLINEEDTRDVKVQLRSPYLIGVLRKCLPHVAETLCSEEPEIDAKDLFLIWPALRQELELTQEGSTHGLGDIPQVDANGGKGQSNTLQEALHDGNGNEQVNMLSCDSEAECDAHAVSHFHLLHLLRFLQEHFKDTSARFAWMKQKGIVSYNMLWAFFTPGLEVRRLCALSGQACHAIVQSPGKYDHRSWAPEENAFVIKLRVMDYNAERYRKCIMNVKIEEFDGEVPFTSLSVCPWSFFLEEERHCIMETIEHRGGLFYACAMEEPFHFMHFQGSLGYYERALNGCFQLRRVNADGRVMVDLLSLARANPEWPLGNAQPPIELMRGIDKGTRKQEKPSAQELQFAPSVVYGFSFSLKKWGCFDVGGLRKISFNDRAYDQLVMESAKQKEMLRAIVATHLSEKDERGRGLDLVAEKGEGCIVLCYGPPGTGKTLTAETLAETLHRPLWAISAFELGQEAGELEIHLRQVLSTALRWRAVVLLDEADAYLESRTSNVDIKRNLMTGVLVSHLTVHPVRCP
ncbi:hypothetical protein GOP47_0019376 [Adiantum capillus-veneris]|uniref:AAA+ ATPase domain-containing protein n=1 Tax=Adiantum capillus-veneris TaxID=13818 RepID=A0A9D4UCQ2_ADICA|nr:hypothetical protein GOP47_0019376 [Adiantum capillus-veneris]